MPLDNIITMDRRSLMHRALLLVGATMATSGCDMLAGAGNAADFALDAQQMALLSAVAGTIMPKTETAGAVEAGVPEKLEGLMRDWASAETRESLLGALERIDLAAREQSTEGFAAMNAEAQLALLKTHDATALEEDPDGTPVPATSPFDAGGLPKRDPGYAQLKDLVLTLYYYSEPALTQELSYEHNPGTWDPSVPVTEDTRPAGGFARF